MLHTLRFSLQNVLYFIMLAFLVPVLFTFYMQDVLNLNVKLRCQKVNSLSVIFNSSSPSSPFPPPPPPSSSSSSSSSSSPSSYPPFSSSSSSVGATARCGLWPVEQYLSIFLCLSPSLSIFSLPTLEDLFLLLLLHPFLDLPLRFVPSSS